MRKVRTSVQLPGPPQERRLDDMPWLQPFCQNRTLPATETSDGKEIMTKPRPDLRVDPMRKRTSTNYSIERRVQERIIKIAEKKEIPASAIVNDILKSYLGFTD